MKTCLALIVCVATSLPAFGQTASTPATPEKQLTWKAGAASAVITPQDNLWMAGYSARKKPADGKAQDLFAKALAIEDQAGRRLVMLTMDFIGVRRTLRDAVAARCQAGYKLPPECLLMNASHTHCGPELSAKPGFEEQTQRYYQFLEDTIVKVIGQAIERLAPASVSYAHSRCGFAMNRR